MKIRLLTITNKNGETSYQVKYKPNYWPFWSYAFTYVTRSYNDSDTTERKTWYRKEEALEFIENMRNNCLRGKVDTITEEVYDTDIDIPNS
jgi:hypothetical protein